MGAPTARHRSYPEAVSAVQPERYGAGLPRVESRPLHAHEARFVRRALRRARATLVGTSALSAGAVAASILAPDHLDAEVLLAAGGPFGVLLGTLACSGAMACVLVGARLERWTVAVSLLVLGGFGIVGLALPEARPPHPRLVQVLVAVLLGGGAWFLAARVRAALSLLRHRALVCADMEGGIVDRCIGRPRRLSARSLRVLRRRGDLDDHGGPHTVDILPSSGLVLRVDGRAPRRPLLASVARIAPAAPHALRIALPPDLAAVSSPTVQLQRRSLTPAESEELSRHAATMRRPPFAVWLAGVSGLALAAASLAISQTTLQLVSTAGPALLLLAAALAHHLRRMRAATRLLEDQSLRWLVTVSDRDPHRADAAPRLEMLPVSQLAWSEHADPAPWRVDDG